MMKICCKCKLEKPSTEEFFFIRKSKFTGKRTPNGWCKECQKLPEVKAFRSAYHQELRIVALCKYGETPPRCACCSESELKFLAIDHIHGGGSKHRKEIRKLGQTIYIWMKKNNYPAGFQVLCHNCNLAKGYYGECPHKKQIKT